MIRRTRAFLLGPRPTPTLGAHGSPRRAPACRDGAHRARLLGARPRVRIAWMLQGLGLSPAEVDEVIAHGLAKGLFEVDPTNPAILRAPPQGGGEREGG